MNKKARKEREIAQLKQEKKGWIMKLRPLLLPALFGVGALIAQWINTNEYMTKVVSKFNVGYGNILVVQILTYLGVIGLIVLGIVFQNKLDKQDAALEKNR